MGVIRPAVEPVLLFAGFLFKDADTLNQALEMMTASLGPVCLESGTFDFTHTDYYEKEMGPGLKRKFAAFRDFAAPDSLAGTKTVSNRIEDALAVSGKRRVNIDPGYLDLAKLVLASTKDFSHRLYLGENIFGEVSMRYIKGGFQPLEWTYPDYREPQTLEFFNHARQYYAARRSQAVSGA